MKRYFLLFILSVVSLFQSCNEISSKTPVLTNENSIALKITKKYWIAQDENGKTGEFGFILDDAKHKKQEWALELVPPKKREMLLKARLKKIDRKRFIIQLELNESGKTGYSFFVVKRMKNNTYIIPSYTKEAIKKAKTDTILAPFQEHFKATGSSIVFDEFMTTNNKDAIIAYIKSLNEHTDLKQKEALIFKGTNDKLLFEAMLAKPINK